MRISKCPTCKTKIVGIATECPICRKKFMCKCGKELDDNKDSRCPLCRTKSKEKAKKVAKGAGAVLAVIGTAAGAAAANNKKNNSK